MTQLSTRHMQSGKLATFVPFIIVALLALTIGFMLQQKKANAPVELPEFERTILFDTPRLINDFSLFDQDGDVFNNESLKGQWNVLFFGFTHCPDVCPSTLLALKNVRQTLEANQNWPNLNVVMVSVDPDRDAPERLKPYVTYFHPEFKGVTGDVDAITAFAKELGILFIKKDADENGYYDVDHGVSMILMNADGHYAGVITAPHTEKVLEADLAKLAAHVEQTSAAGKAVASASEVGKASSDAPNTQTITSDFAANSIRVNQQWVRAAPPNSPMAAYLEMTNTSSEPIVISGASSPLFGNVMIHETVVEDGLAGMRHMDELVVPANESISFAPMGTHIMLMRPRHLLKLRDQIPITLSTSQGDISFIALVSEQAPE